MSGPPTMVFVGDDERVARRLPEAVEARSGETVTVVVETAAGAADVLDADNREVRCLVVASSLPDRDGVALASTVAERRPATPVAVVATRDATAETAARAVRAGVDEYVTTGDDPGTAAERLLELAATASERGAPVATVEAVPDPFLTVSPEGDLVEWNAAAERFAGDPESLRDAELDALVTGSDADRFREAVAGATAGDSRAVEVDLVDPAGEAIPHEFVGRCVTRPDGTVAVCGVARDVSLRRRRERVLQGLQAASRDLMAAETVAEVAEETVDAARGVLGQQQSAVHLLDEDEDALRPVAVTDHAETVFDEIPSLGPGTVAWDAFRSGEVRRFDDVREADDLLNPETDVRSELIAPIGDHGVIIISAAEPGEFGEFDETFTRTLATTAAAALDRTERTELLRRRERRLTERNETLDRFVATVSHDLRSPLTVARGRVELAEQTGDLDDLAQAVDALDRAEEIVDDLLTLVKQGESIGDLERVDVAMIARQAWKGVDTGDVELVVDDEAGSIRADPGRLRQLLENLYANAVEHNESISQVRVSYDGDHLVVSDDGEGIDPEVRADLFEAGFTTNEDGTGYGLSIVAEVAEAHGWEIGVAESEAGGAKFVFET